MYIVRRMGHTQGMQGIEKAVEVTQIVQQAGMPVSLWVGGPGLVPGTVAWSVPVESFAQWAAYTDTLAADAAYTAFARENVGTILFTEPDVLSEIVHGDLGTMSEVGDYLGAIEATIQLGKEADAWAFAVEAADSAAAVAGLNVVVTNNAAGEQGTISWLVRYGAAGAFDDAAAKLAASADYQAVLAKAGGLFSSGNRLMARRAA